MMNIATPITNPVRADIPLSELFLSPENMRHSRTSKAADNELRASIAAHGIINNLVVSEKTTNGYAIEAGSRRFEQLMALVKTDQVASDELIPVLILPPNTSAKEISLVENVMREDPHPIDEYEAYLDLFNDEGTPTTVAVIAGRFGKSKKYIQQRLLLGGVSEKLRELCRKGAFGIDVLESFTVSTDLDKQSEAYDTFKDEQYRFTPKNIKAFLTNHAISTKDKLVKFVGLSAYKKAGGTTTADLFDNNVLINEQELLESLVAEKIAGLLKEYQKDWTWAEYKENFQPWNLSNYRTIESEIENAPQNILDEIKEKQVRFDWLRDIDYNLMTEEQDKEYDELEVQIEELEATLEQYKVFKKDEMQFAGIFLTLADDGTVTVYTGLVKDSDITSLNNHRNPNANNSNENAEVNDSDLVVEKPLYTQVMKDDLASYRKSIAKVAVSKDINLGSDLLQFNLCYSVVRDGWFEHPLETQVSCTFEDSSKGDIVNSKAQKELDDAFGKLDRSWVKDEMLESFKAYRDLPSKTKKQINAYCAGYSLVSRGISDEAIEFSDYLCEESKIEKADYFRPLASNYFKRINEPHFSDLVIDIMGESWMEENRAKKKAYIAECLELAVSSENGSTSINSDQFLNSWLPLGL